MACLRYPPSGGLSREGEKVDRQKLDIFQDNKYIEMEIARA